MCVFIIHIYIIYIIKIYIYIYIYINRTLPTDFYVFIKNQGAQCSSHTSSAQELKLPESHFGDDRESTLFS